MAFDLTGIVNENEYYTHHYLQAILEGDLKEVFKGWQAQKDADAAYVLPQRRLGALARPFFASRDRLEHERIPEARLAVVRERGRALCEALDYPVQPGLEELDDGALVPVLGVVRKPGGAAPLWIVEALDPAREGDDPLEVFPVFRIHVTAKLAIQVCRVQHLPINI